MNQEPNMSRLYIALRTFVYANWDKCKNMTPRVTTRQRVRPPYNRQF
jgi:hypothetical protein